MQSATGIAYGLDDFLGHIRKSPASEKLVERYLDLVAELTFDKRREAMAKLIKILVTDNPHKALHSSYVYLQKLRSEGAPSAEEIVALELAQICFQKLGKSEHITVVQDEIVRLRSLKPTVSDAEPRANTKEDVVTVAVAVNHFGSNLQTEKIHQHELPPELPNKKQEAPLSHYDKFSDDLFKQLRKELGSFTTTRHQQLAVSTLIRAYQQIYVMKAAPLRRALVTYGRNPLLWTIEGGFRNEIYEYFLESRLFSMGRDGLTEVRLRTCLELLTSWFDQKLLVNDKQGVEMIFQKEFSLLETALLAVVDKDI